MQTNLSELHLLKATAVHKPYTNMVFKQPKTLSQPFCVFICNVGGKGELERFSFTDLEENKK